MSAEERGEHNRTLAWNFVATDKDKPFNNFGDCMAAILAGNQTAFDKSDLESYKELAKTKTYETGLKFMKFFEAQFKCSGICKPALFYWTRPISDGRPTQTCMIYLKDAIKNNLTYLGIVSIVAGGFTLFAFLIQYCLWKKYE